jgi:hypothetical protein
MSMRQYAKHRGVSAMAVSKAVKAGRIALTDGKLLDSDLADAAWARNTRANVNEHQKPSPKAKARAQEPEEYQPESRPRGESPTPGTLAHAQLVHETAKAKKASLEALRLEGKYAELAAVRRAVGSLVAAAKMRLRAIGNGLAPDLAVETNPAAIQAKIEAEIDEALSELARWEPETAA